MELKIEKYIEEEHFYLWDDFVMNNSVNGTIFNTRKFLSYHPKDRFEDKSILIYDDNKLAAVVLFADYNNILHSHPGTSGGGAIIAKKYYSIDKLIKIIEAIDNYIGESNFALKISESISFEGNNNSILHYSLNRIYKASSEISFYFNLNDIEDVILNIKRSRVRSAVRKELKEGSFLYEGSTEKDYIDYYSILSENLRKHDLIPVHTFKEFIDLSQLLDAKQRLLLWKNNRDEILAGVWVIEQKSNIWHAQYIAKDYEKSTHASLAALLIKIVELAKNEGKDFFNLGVCTEIKGSYLNLGLAEFKESLGAKGIERFIFDDIK